MAGEEAIWLTLRFLTSLRLADEMLLGAARIFKAPINAVARDISIIEIDEPVSVQIRQIIDGAPHF